MVSLQLALTPHPEMRASPALVAFTTMLSLPAQEIDALLAHEVETNPALEVEDSGVCPICRSDAGPFACPLCSPRRPSRHVLRDRGDDFAWHTGQESDAQELLKDARAQLRGAQIGVAEYIVGCLDRHGFLKESVEKIADELAVDRGLVEEVVETLRQAGPVGVASPGVRDHLLAQLDELDGGHDEVVRLARFLVSDFFEILGSPELLARRLGFDGEVVAKAIHFISSELWPFPKFELHPPRYSPGRDLPDLAFLLEPDRPGGIRAEVLEPFRLNVRINPLYEKPPHGLTSSELEVMAEQAQRGRQLLKRLRSRWETLRRIGQAILDEQKEFVRGSGVVQPLTRARIAGELGLHESTISRATADRTVLMPSGRILPLKAFFDQSAEAREHLRRLIESERQPLSDSALAVLLAESGHRVARRTVVKYRYQLGIPAAAARAASPRPVLT